MRILLILMLLYSTNAFSKSYKLWSTFIKELMCLHNMDESYCREWINKGTITLYKYRKIEQGCLNGAQFLCTYIVYVQDRMPTPMTNEVIAMSEFGCKSGNGVHCLILASIDPIHKKEYLKKGCEYKENLACKKLARLTRSTDGKIKVNIQEIKKGLKDALNKMMSGKKK